MARQIITKNQVDEVLEWGELCLAPGAIVTPLAAEYAQDRGVRLVYCDETGVDRDRVRNAIVAIYGTEPPALDAVLDRVLGS